MFRENGRNGDTNINPNTNTASRSEAFSECTCTVVTMHTLHYTTTFMSAPSRDRVLMINL
uniref:Uncharacterized protein n=1 Tax=Oryza sativa subsp. japonica TaxID=39947 RepID=Q5Z4L6_ORYSJ|nr:hypothetical protein [Oryza sativa Japonica Group]BAD62316.1 hypothetical protein [Oryza sativa Japonica Group]